MHHPFRLATFIGVAFALTACSDSVNRLTEPNGPGLARAAVTPLSPALTAVYTDIVAKLNSIYFCESSAGNKKTSDKNSDLANMKKFAEFGWWTSTDKPGSQNVAYMANKLITDMEANIARGTIPASCAGHYADAAALNQLVTDAKFLINVFAGQGTYEGANFCPNTTDCERTGNGWKFHIPANSFGSDVIVVVKPNNGPAPQDFTPAENSASFNFDVFPAGEANSPWTRYICWEGTNDENEPNEDWIVMVREAGNGDLEYLPTVWEPWDGATCTTSTTSSNLFLKGATKLLAGMPFLPKTLDAYSPPRTFGGTSKASSPHWLTVVEPIDPPDDFTLQDLYDLTAEYYGAESANKTAALGKLQDAINCGEDTACVNTALQQYINNVRAQTGKQGLTVEEGEELMGLAQGFMQ